MHSSAIYGYRVKKYTPDDLEKIREILKSPVKSLTEKLKDKDLKEDNQVVLVILIIYILSKPDLSKLLKMWSEVITNYNNAIRRNSENQKAHKLVDRLRKPVSKSAEDSQLVKNVHEKLLENISDSDEGSQHMISMYQKLVEEIRKSSASEEIQELQIERIRTCFEVHDLIKVIHSLAHKLTTKIKFSFTESQSGLSELKIEEEGIRDFVHLEIRNNLIDVLKEARNVEIVFSKKHGPVARIINIHDTIISKIARSYVSTSCYCQFGSTDSQKQFIIKINSELENCPINPQISRSEDNILTLRRDFQKNHDEPFEKTLTEKESFSETDKLAAHDEMQNIIKDIDKWTHKSNHFCGILQEKNRLIIGCYNHIKHIKHIEHIKHTSVLNKNCLTILLKIIEKLENATAKDKNFFLKAGITDIYLYPIADYTNKHFTNIRFTGVNLTIDFARYKTVNYATTVDYATEKVDLDRYKTVDHPIKKQETIKCIPAPIGNIYLTGNLTIIGTVLLDPNYRYNEFFNSPSQKTITCEILVDGQIKIQGSLIVEAGRRNEVVMLVKAYSLFVEGLLIGNLDINLIPIPSNRQNIKNTIFVDDKIVDSKIYKYISINKGTTHNCAYIDSKGKATISLKDESLQIFLRREMASSVLPPLESEAQLGEYGYITLYKLPGYSPFINPVTCTLFATKCIENYIKETDMRESSPNTLLSLGKNAVSSFTRFFFSR